MTTKDIAVPSFKIVRDQPCTYQAILQVVAIENGFLIDGGVGIQHYATPEALRAALAALADCFVEEVTKCRAEASKAATP